MNSMYVEYSVMYMECVRTRVLYSKARVNGKANNLNLIIILDDWLRCFTQISVLLTDV